MLRIATRTLLAVLIAQAAVADVVLRDVEDLLTVNTAKAVLAVKGASTRATFKAGRATNATSSVYRLSVEAAPTIGFQVVQVCVSYGLGATAAGTIVTTTLQRIVTPSSGGTALVNEIAGTNPVSMHGIDGNAFGGIGRANGTAGTVGAVLDQWQFPQTVVAATVGITPISIHCRDYGGAFQPIRVPAGVNNGIQVLVSTGGAGSLAVGAISATVIQE